MALCFHQLTLADKSLVERYTLHSSRMNCDLSFVNLYAWQTLYQTEVAEWGGFLFFRFQTDGHLAYLCPVGNGDRAMALGELKEDACAHGHPLLILGLCEDWLPVVERMEAGRFRLDENRDHADYIYSREALANLAGKKLQSKRNHVNAFFRNYPDARFEPLEKKHVTGCLELAREWAASRTGRGEQRAVAAELCAIERALGKTEELGLMGGVLVAGGKIVAFTYGGTVNDETFDVCVEKADLRYEGAYAAINRSFAAYLPERFRYINREEDLGIEGLRKAKLSYRPLELLKKYAFWSACGIQRKDKETDEQALNLKWQVRALWKLCFNDSNAFIQLYFDKKYRNDSTDIVLRQGRVVSALQRLPYSMSYYGLTVPVAYLSGLCTHPEYRGNGLMSSLIRQAHRKMYEVGCWFSLLIPADESLVSYYARFGYAKGQRLALESRSNGLCDAKTDDSIHYTIYNSKNGLPEEVIVRYFAERLGRMQGAVVHSSEDMDVVFETLFLEGGVVVTAECCSEVVGVAIAVRGPGLETMTIIESQAESIAVEQFLCRKAAEALNVPADGMVIPYVSTYDVQMRIIRIPEVLKAVAAAHLDMACSLRLVGDDAIPENNGIYRLEGGDCRFGGVPDCCAESVCVDRIMDVVQLSKWVFDDGGPYLSMMLN